MRDLANLRFYQLNCLAEVAAVFRKLADAISKAAKLCMNVQSPSECMYGFSNDEIDIDSLVTTVSTWTSFMEALRDFEPRKTTPKTPYKPSFKTVIFDKRLKFPKCRSNCR